MANVNSSGVFTLKSADAFTLGNGSDECVGTYAIQLVSSSFSGSITVKARSASIAAAAETPLAVNYLARYLNGAIATDSLVSTAITGTSLILVPCSGQTIVLDCTSYVSGSMKVYPIALAGAAA